MKWMTYARKKMFAVTLVGAAAAIMAAIPYGMASAADAEAGSGPICRREWNGIWDLILP